MSSQSQSWFQALGIDVVCYITQFLSQDELRIFMQLNQSCAQLLEQRHQAYHHPPLPSFHRLEFNLNTYRKWMINRQFLVVTSSKQFLSYSHSRIMTHASDIELLIDEYCVHPLHSPPKSTTTISRLPRLDQLRSAINRFRHVRSVRLVFRPSTIDHDRAYAHCPCEAESVHKEAEFHQWFLPITEMCLEAWASKLVSFEVEWDSHYRCSLPIRMNFPFALLPRMDVLQHLGIFIPQMTFGLPPYLPPSVSAFQFPDEDRSLFIFEGVCRYQQNEESRIMFPTTFTNASHVVWIQAPGWIPVFEYLKAAGHDGVTGPLQDHSKPQILLRPIISIQRQQLRSLVCCPTRELDEDPLNVKKERQALLKYLTTNASSLESLTMIENWTTADDPHLISTYAQHLHPLRTSLKLLKWNCNIFDLKLLDGSVKDEEDDGPVESQLITVMCHGCHLAPIPVGQPRWKCKVCKFFHYCESCYQSNQAVGSGHLIFHQMIQINNEEAKYSSSVPPLPITLIPGNVDDACMQEHQWTTLESFELRYGPWETSLQPKEPALPPMTRKIWIALERTLPALESLGLSLGLLPLGVEPLSGILLRIKHLTLFDMNHWLVPQTIAHRTLCDYLSSALTTIVIQLRQLESINLKLSAFGPDVTGHWNEFSMMDCLLSITLSSSNLRSLSIPAIALTPGDSPPEGFEAAYQNHLFRAYAIWQLLQPSFDPPLDYTSIRTFLYPLLAPIWRSKYDIEFLRMQSKKRPPVSTFFSRATALIRSKWSQWMNGDAEARQREMKRLELIHTRTNSFQLMVDRLRTRMGKLFQQHPHLSFQPRVFTFNLDPINFHHPPELQ